ncbi:hypothetical protein EH196_19305 [Bacillus sp. C1-1]|nr:hypothetical protein EH196_19305 [Bacillus sp. C1-1]
MKKQSKWASNTLGDGHKAEVYYFKANEYFRDMIMNLSDSLYEWESPNLPEDLSFFVNGQVWMATSSHEKECYIYPTDETHERALKKIKGLKVKRIDD